MKLAGKTDVGSVRQENQDNYRAQAADRLRLGSCATAWAVRGEAAKPPCCAATSWSKCLHEHYESACPGMEKTFIMRWFDISEPLRIREVHLWG